MGQGLLASPQEANPLPRSRTFLGEKKMGASLLPRILFSSVRCFLCTCFVLPVHFGGQSFLSPTTPALSRSAPGLQPLGIASWGGGGAVPGSPLIFFLSGGCRFGWQKLHQRFLK